MATTEMNCLASGGGIEFNLSDMQQSATNQQVSATVGKKYFISYAHGGGGGDIISGATKESEYQYKYVDGQVYTYMVVAVATSNTIVLKGGGNTVFYMQLD